jgi:threonine dehydrogenase-like Zn-dependent dehydrogenase
MALIPLALLRQADLLAGEWLGVVGLGLVGNLGAQFGLHAGCGVIGVGRSELRNQIAVRCGIENVVTGDVEAIAESARSLTHGLGCRFVLETTGTPQGLQKALALVADGGTIALVGVPWQDDASLSASAVMQPVFSRYLSIIGGWEWGIPLFERDADRPAPMISHRHSTEANARYAAESIQRGAVQVEPLITHRIAPESIQSAYQGLLRQRDEYLGVLIRWDA